MLIIATLIVSLALPLMTGPHLSFGYTSGYTPPIIVTIVSQSIRASRPADFSYKHDAKHNSMFIVAKAWDDTDDDTLVLELTHVLNGAKTG